MGVGLKNRRKITVAEKRYVWYVAPDYDSADIVLHVSSIDKQFLIKYQLHQTEIESYIVVLGPRFSGAVTGGCWKRFACPLFVTNIVKPSAVRSLIEWCLDDRLARHEVRSTFPLGL